MLFIGRLFSCASIARAIGMPAPPPHEEIPSLEIPPHEETPDARTDVCALGLLARALTAGRSLSPALEDALDRATPRAPPAPHHTPDAFAPPLRAPPRPRDPPPPPLHPGRAPIPPRHRRQKAGRTTSWRSSQQKKTRR